MVMDELIKQAEQLRNSIKAKEREIDNPSLVMGVLGELEFFIDTMNDFDEVI